MHQPTRKQPASPPSPPNNRHPPRMTTSLHRPTTEQKPSASSTARSPVRIQRSCRGRGAPAA
jgi:hypothetical protein